MCCVILKLSTKYFLKLIEIVNTLFKLLKSYLQLKKQKVKITNTLSNA